MAQERTPVYFANLDALRSLAFLSVFFQHSFATDSPGLASSPAFHFLVTLTKHGALGVSFFFVLSGFLITYLLLVEEESRGEVSIANFYLRRVLRIWPLYYACLFAGFLVLPQLKRLIGAPPEASPEAWWYLSFLANFDRIVNGAPDSVIGILWSVAIEEQFYVVWPIALLLGRAKRGVVLGAVVFASLAYRVASSHDSVRLYYHTLSCISDMAVGGLLAWLIRTYPRVLERVTNLSRPTILAAYCGGVALILARHRLFPLGLPAAFERLFTGAFFAFVIAEQIWARRSLFKVGRLPGLTHWGKYTYGLYCLHFWGIYASVAMSRRLGLAESPVGVFLVQTALALGLSLGIAWISYELFEKRFLELKRRFSMLSEAGAKRPAP